MNKKALITVNIKKFSILVFLLLFIIGWGTAYHALINETLDDIYFFSDTHWYDHHPFAPRGIAEIVPPTAFDVLSGRLARKIVTPLVFSWSEYDANDRNFPGTDYKCDYKGVLFFPFPNIRYVVSKNCYDHAQKGTAPDNQMRYF